MENFDEETKDAVDQIYKYAVILLVNEEKTPEETIKILIKKGLDEETATQIVQNLLEHIGTAKQEKAKKDMIYGALWCLGGICVTVFTLAAASGGGTYVVAWGAVIFGAIQFFRGLSNNEK